MNDAELESLLGAYALDAVDGPEADALEAHLRYCPRCRAELADHREVAAMLAHEGSPAPEGVWNLIEASLEEAPPRMELAPLRRRGRVPTFGWRAATAVMSVAAVLLIGVLGVRVVDDGRRIDRLASASQGEQLLRAANAALTDPGARRVALRSPGNGLLSAEAVVLPDGAGYVVKSNLPKLQAERAYQLWALSGTSKISIGVLGPSVRAAAFQAPSADLWGLAITQERAGGVIATQNPPIVLGQVRPEARPPTPVDS